MTPAKWWRADGGYQDAPEETPQQTLFNMCFCQTYGGGYGGAGRGLSFGPWIMPQTSFLQGPIPIAGLSSPPPPYAPFGGPAPACAPPACAPPEPEKKEDKKGDKKEDKKENPWAPPKLPDGANYLFDGEHTMINIFRKAAPIWTEKYRTQTLGFKMFKVSVNFTVRMVIEQTLKKSGDDCRGWAATEAVERGDGQWDKGTTIEYDSDKSKGTLKSMGWSSKRGDALPPVWLVVHKVDFK